MIRNAPELGTVWAQTESSSYFMTSSAHLSTDGEIVKAESLACSPSRLAPSVHERPEPDCQQDKEQDERSSPYMGKRRRIGRDRPDQEPAEHDADGEKQGAFERLSVVELSEPKKDAGEDHRNDFPPRIGYTWAHRGGLRDPRHLITSSARASSDGGITGRAPSSSLLCRVTLPSPRRFRREARVVCGKAVTSLRAPPVSLSGAPHVYRW
jgi:hypothetical protein